MTAGVKVEPATASIVAGASQPAMMGGAAGARASIGNAGLTPFIVLGCFSILALLGFSSVYSCLAVLIPRMHASLGFTWTQMGLGYTLIGVACAMSSFLPTKLIQRFGVWAPLTFGPVLIFGGLMTIAFCHQLSTYLIAVVLCGIGYQMISLIPGIHVLLSLFRRRSLAIGLYFTSVSVGGVAGPWLVLGALNLSHGNWRVPCAFFSVLVLILGLTCCAIITRLVGRRELTGASKEAEDGATGWSVVEAIRTPQFWLCALGYFAHLLVLNCIGGMSVAHITQRGFSPAIGAAMLSMESTVQVAARFLGGAAGEFVSRKILLVIGLTCAAAGLWTLSLASDMRVLFTYAILSGVGVGLSGLSSTLLLLEYFGKKHNLALFSIVCTMVAGSSFVSLLGGAIRDTTGSFALAFQAFGSAVVILLLAWLVTGPPRPRFVVEAIGREGG